MEIHQKQSGLAILELLIAMALLAIAGSFCAFMDNGAGRGFYFNADCQAVLAALRRARAMSLANVGAGNAAPHGVRFDPARNDFIFFSGAIFDNDDPANEKIDFEGAATRIAGANSVDVIFSPITGGASSTEIVIQDDFGRSVKISVNELGRVDRE